MIDSTVILGIDKCFAIQKMVKQGLSLDLIKEKYKYASQKDITKYYNRLVDDKSKLYDEEEWKW